MKTIIIDKKDTSFSTNTSSLIVNNQKIPFKLIDVILLFSKVSLTTTDINRLTKNSINIVLLNQNYYATAYITPTKSKNAQLKMAQYKAALNPIKIAKMLLSKKITSHIMHLKNHNIILNKSRYLSNINKASTLDELLGIEGSFSKLYFNHYFSLLPKNLHNNKRQKRPPKDPINATLSWLYTIAYSLISIRLFNIGFEPTIGFLHRPFREHNALASDILEVIRADINEYVYDLFKNKHLSAKEFTRRQDAIYLKYDAKVAIYKNINSFLNSIYPKIDATITDIRSLL